MVRDKHIKPLQADRDCERKNWKEECGTKRYL